MSKNKPLPCPFCHRELVIIKEDEEKDGVYFGHPRNTPPESCFIHSLIVFFDQVDHWNVRVESIMVSKESPSPNYQEIAKELDNHLNPLGFVLLSFDFCEPGIANYVSNANRKDVVKAMFETAYRLKEV